MPDLVIMPTPARTSRCLGGPGLWPLPNRRHSAAKGIPGDRYRLETRTTRPPRTVILSKKSPPRCCGYQRQSSTMPTEFVPMPAAQGWWPSSLMCVDGVDNVVVVLRAAAVGRPGLGQTDASPVLTPSTICWARWRKSIWLLCGKSVACKAIQSLQRPRSGGLFHRIGGHRRNGACSGCLRPALRRHAFRSNRIGASVLAPRHRRIGRRCGVGGGLGLRCRQTRRSRLDRRPEPTVAGSGVPAISAGRLAAMFSAAGRQTLTVTFGRLSRACFAVRGEQRCGPGPGDAQRRISRLLRCPQTSYAAGCPARAPAPAPLGSKN